MPGYLDHAATTPMRPAAVEAMLPFLSGERFGNPSATHARGRDARRALDDARDVLAEVVGAEPGDVVFTSGGTEADNHAVLAGARTGGVLVCSAVEHHAVLEPVLAAGGFAVPVDELGRVDLEALADLVAGPVGLVSVQLVNNEVGVVQPVAEVVEVVRRLAPDALVHCDAVQGLGWLDVAAATEGVDLVSVSAHKVGGPKGIGALVARRGGRALPPLLRGGGQERDRRSGTPNVAGAVAFGVAAALAADARKAEADRVAALRDRLLDEVPAVVPWAVPTVAARSTLAPHIAHLCVEGVESEALLFLLDHAGIAASAAASCAAGAMDPSHVLAAMGIDRARAGGALRLSLGWSSTDEDVDRVLAALPGAVDRLRGAA